MDRHQHAAHVVLSTFPFLLTKPLLLWSTDSVIINRLDLVLISSQIKHANYYRTKNLPTYRYLYVKNTPSDSILKSFRTPTQLPKLCFDFCFLLKKLYWKVIYVYSFKSNFQECGRHVRLAYQPLASNTFISKQISHQQPANCTFLSE
jgi:hypothetical protein